MKDFLKRTVEAVTPSSQQVVTVLKKVTECTGSHKFETIFAVKDDSPLHEVGSERDSHTLTASTAVGTYAAVDARGSQCSFTLFLKKVFFQLLVNGNTFL